MKKIIKIIILSLILGFFINQNANATKKLDILLLGDSYSAGNGASHYSGIRECYRSQNNWANIFSRHLNNQGIKTSFHNHACSGATTNNLISPRLIKSKYASSRFLGHFSKKQVYKKLLKNNDCHKYYGNELDHIKINNLQIQQRKNKFGKVTIANYQCEYFLRPQIDFVQKNNDLIMFTIGGNDVGFSSIIENCFAIQNTKECINYLNKANKKLYNLKENIIITLNKIRSKNKKAKIIILGYPLLSTKSKSPFFSIDILGNDVRKLGIKGNKFIKNTINNYNKTNSDEVLFIDNIITTFNGHEPDPRLITENKKRWINELFDPGFDMAEWYHPNPKGHQAYANLLKEKAILKNAAKIISPTSADLDIVFNIDISGSMEDDITNVRQEIKNIIDETNKKSNSARFAITTFSIDDPETTAKEDFAQVATNFTNDINLLQNTLNKIHATNTGYESNFSGIMTGLNLPWRNGVHKAVITMTDEPPEDEKYYTGYDSESVIQKAFAVDPAQLYFINTGPEENNQYYQKIADETGGKVYNTRSDLISSMINKTIDKQLTKPHAWINGPYLVKTGEKLEIDAGGSYSTNGKITKYEWDFDNDGNVDRTTTEPIIKQKFTKDYYGIMSVRITDDKGIDNIATTPLIVSNDGDMIPPEEDNCPNTYNHSQIDSDGDGLGDECDKTHGNPWVEMYNKAQADYQKQVEEQIKTEQAKVNIKQKIIQPKIKKTLSQPQKPLTTKKQTKNSNQLIAINQSPNNKQKIKIKKDSKDKVNKTKKEEKTKSKSKTIWQKIGKTKLYIILIILAGIISISITKVLNKRII